MIAIDARFAGGKLHKAGPSPLPKCCPLEVQWWEWQGCRGKGESVQQDKVDKLHYEHSQVLPCASFRMAISKLLNDDIEYSCINSNGCNRLRHCHTLIDTCAQHERKMTSVKRQHFWRPSPLLGEIGRRGIMIGL